MVRILDKLKSTIMYLRIISLLMLSWTALTMHARIGVKVQ